MRYKLLKPIALAMLTKPDITCSQKYNSQITYVL